MRCDEKGCVDLLPERDVDAAHDCSGDHGYMTTAALSVVGFNISGAFENLWRYLQAPIAFDTVVRTHEAAWLGFPLEIFSARVVDREALHKLLDGWRFFPPTRWKKPLIGADLPR